MYELLGVSKTASKIEIKKAYHKAALSSHPDKVPAEEREEAEIKFKAVSQAYEILYDDETREQYDRSGMSAFEKGGMGGGTDGVDLDDLLAQMFGMGMGGMPGMGRGPGGMPGGRPGRKMRGKDVVHQYEVSLEDLYKGKTVKLSSTRNKLCSACNGIGGKDKSRPKKCANCDGKGWNQSLRQVGPGLVTQEQVPCSNCRMTGHVFREKDRCRKCKGACVTEEKKVLEVYIPRGSKEGDKIVLEGEADEQPGYETGDIVFILQEKEHEVLTRVGPDLSATIKIGLLESLTGFSRVVVKHLDGRGIQLTHPVGEFLRNGQVLKITGEGMPHKKGEGKGDLYLVVEIVFPEKGWTPDVEAIKAALPDYKPESITGEPVDEHDYIREANLEEIGGEDESWEDEDDDDEEGPQCAQQ